MLQLPAWVSADCNLLVSGSPSCVIVKPGQTYHIDPINKWIIRKMNPFVVATTCIKFKSAFLHLKGAVNFFRDLPVFGQIKKIFKCINYQQIQNELMNNKFINGISVCMLDLACLLFRVRARLSLRFKLSRRYNKMVGNQTSWDLFGLFFFCFSMKVARYHVPRSWEKFLAPSKF